jgi:hypothetical protein
VFNGKDGHMERNEFLAGEKQRISVRTTITIVGANVGRWLGGLAGIPKEVVQAGRSVLSKAHKEGAIRDFRLHPFGDELCQNLVSKMKPRRWRRTGKTGLCVNGLVAMVIYLRIIASLQIGRNGHLTAAIQPRLKFFRSDFHAGGKTGSISLLYHQFAIA